ncbi:MAG: molybdopterin-dependent oxidoreductase [Myxococcota bacterium]
MPATPRGTEIGRREFLSLAGSGVAGLYLAGLRPRTGRARLSGATAPIPSYQDWRDLYRTQLRWDRRVRCTHVVNCWYQRHCAWDVYVKDGLVLREEQAGDYPQVSPDVPDFNPRGCQKGACYSALLYAPDRLRHPLRRAGPRGSGRWRRVSWDEALREIADRLIDALERDEPETIVLDPGGNLASGTWRVALERLIRMLDGIELDTNTELDDGQGGAALTFGTPVASRSADDFFRSDLILIWGANPVYTQIPNAHFLNEARYHGARVVTIAPDYSASSIHADLFVPIRPGTDAALALSLAQVLLEQGRIDAEFLRVQTDLPLLVRENGRFLRESDRIENGREDRFYAYDLRSQSVVPAPERSLDWGEAEPALEGRFQVWTREGLETVRPVLDRLRKRLDRDYTPEKASRICGVSPKTIRRLARWIADARALSGVAGSSIPKLYHGDLIMRAQILVFLLGGHLGRPGAGYDTCPFLLVDGLYRVGVSQLDALLQKLRLAPRYVAGLLRGETRERILSEIVGEYMERSNWFSSVLYWRRHGGLIDPMDRTWKRNLPRPVEDYVRESYAKGWQKEPPLKPPKVLLIAGSNLLRRLRSADLLLEKLWPKIDLIVTTDTRMSTTALHSDLLLPGATSYEKDDVPNWITLLSPYVHLTQAAVPPPGDAKVEWEIHVRLAGWIERRAHERGVSTFRDRSGIRRQLDDFERRFSADGRFGSDAQTEVAREIVARTSFLDTDFDSMRRRGYRRVTEIGGHPVNLGNATRVFPDAPIVNRGLRGSSRDPWPTLTRRIQLCIDHPLYLELGEQLPIHKEPPAAGGDYPLILSGGHTRWSIHSMWRNVEMLLHLQRGEAAAFVARSDAEARGIADGDRIRIWNDRGTFEARARVSSAVRPGTLILYHGWEDYQFPSGRGYRNVLPSPLNPVELAGDYGHIRPQPATFQPGQSDRETRVEMARAS